MKRIILLGIVCFLFMSGRIYCQINVDSLLQTIETVGSEEEKLVKLNELSEILTFEDVAKSLDFAKKALNLARKIGNKEEELRAMNSMGICYQIYGEWEKAKEYFMILYEYNLGMNDTIGAGNNLINISTAYDMAGLPDSAIMYLERAEEFLQDSKDIETRIALYTNMAIVLSSVGEYARALKYYQNSLDLCEQIDNFPNKSSVLASMGDLYYSINDFEKAMNCYVEAKVLDSITGNQIGYLNDMLAIGKLFHENQEISKAKEQYLNALGIAREVKHSRGIMFALNNLGSIYVDNEKYQSAEKTFLELISYLEGIDNIAYKSSVYTNLGGVYERMGKYDQAISYYYSSLEIKRSINDLRGIFNMYKGLRNCYRMKNEYNTAILYSDSMLIANDSILNEIKLKEIASLETKYETEKKEQEIALLNKDKKLSDIELEKQRALRKNQLYLFTGLITIIVILSLFLYYRRRLKQKALLEQTLKEQQRIRFNEVVETLEKERKRFASDLHDGLGQILTTAKLNTLGLEDIVTDATEEDKNRYNNSIKLIDDACTEIRNIAYDIMPGSLINLGLIAAVKDLARGLNQSEKITITVNNNGIDERFPEQLEYNVYRILQEIINNILKHSDANNIEISFNKKLEMLDILVVDDGSKIEKDKIANSTGGWRNIQTRITMANAKMDVNEKDVTGNIVGLKFMCN